MHIKFFLKINAFLNSAVKYIMELYIAYTKAIIGEVLTEIPNLPCSYTSQYKEKWHFRNKTFF